jgi:hypothetical protein
MNQTQNTYTIYKPKTFNPIGTLVEESSTPVEESTPMEESSPSIPVPTLPPPPLLHISEVIKFIKVQKVVKYFIQLENVCSKKMDARKIKFAINTFLQKNLSVKMLLDAISRISGKPYKQETLDFLTRNIEDIKSANGMMMISGLLDIERRKNSQ